MEDNSIQDILTLLADRVKLEPKDTEEFVEAMFGIIRDALTRDRMVKIKGLGTFKVVDVDSRESVSVNSGERFTIEGHGKVAFIPDATMKELVNKPFSQFETVVINEGVTFEDDEADTGGKEAEEAVETVNTPSEAPSQDKPQREDKEEPTPAPVVEKAEEGHSSVETYVVDDPTMNTDEDEDAQEDDEPHWTEIPMEGDDYANASRKKRFLRRLAAFKSSRIYKIAMHSAVTLLLMGGSMYVGFLLGKHYGRVPLKVAPLAYPTPTPPHHEAPVENKPSSPRPAAKADTLKATDTIPPAAPKPQPKASTPTPAEPDYGKMDVRVRTGAYKIVGLNRTIKAKEGETLKKISDRTLGLGMECYVEVYNGISANTRLSAGQSIKIPELKLKNKLRK